MVTELNALTTSSPYTLVLFSKIRQQKVCFMMLVYFQVMFSFPLPPPPPPTFSLPLCCPVPKKSAQFSPRCVARNSLYGVFHHYTIRFCYMKFCMYLRLELFFNFFFFRFLNLNGPLQLGGVSTPNLLYPKLTVTSYKGCIRNVISQGKYYDLKTPSYRNGTKEGCPMVDQHCRRHQCDSRSKCVPSWTGYSCSCPFGFSGPTCSRSKFKLFYVVAVVLRICWILLPLVIQSEIVILSANRTQNPNHSLGC